LNPYQSVVGRVPHGFCKERKLRGMLLKKSWAAVFSDEWGVLFVNFLPRWTAVNNSELHSTGAPTSQCLLLLSLSQKQNVRTAASP
jgi:hypothetical protein